MSDANNPENGAKASTRFSMGLLHQASKGRFSTKKSNLGARTVITATVGARPDDQVKTDEAVPGSIDVTYKQPRTESAVLNIENSTQESLPSDRISIDQDHFFSATANRKELLITASAAKSLTKLFAALAEEPGSGNEVPGHIRTQILHTLVRESHDLANALCTSVVGEGNRVPVYLRAKLLQQSAEFVSNQWIKDKSVNTKSLKEIAQLAFTGHVEGLNQEIVDLFHHAGEYTPATTQEISQARITEASIRASWSLLKQVQEFDLRDYDKEIPQDMGFQSFTYGRDPYSVSKDLIQIALKITKENELHLDHLDLSTNWTQNSIDRATTLVRSEYQMMTDRALRSSFKDELFSEAAINHVNGLYDQILERIYSRARNGFILVERNAIDAMSATSFTHYLPKDTANIEVNKTNSQNLAAKSISENQIDTQESAPDQSKDVQNVAEPRSTSPSRTFSFFNRQKAG